MSWKKSCLGQTKWLELTVKSLFLIYGLILMLIQIYLWKSLTPWAIQQVCFFILCKFLIELLNFVNILMVEDRVQNLDSVTCNIFQLYFNDNLFNPNENSKIKHKARLNKRTIELLLNERSVLDDQETNETIRQYANDNNINLT